MNPFFNIRGKLKNIIDSLKPSNLYRLWTMCNKNSIRLVLNRNIYLILYNHYNITDITGTYVPQFIYVLYVNVIHLYNKINRPELGMQQSIGTCTIWYLFITRLIMHVHSTMYKVIQFFINVGPNC